MAKRKKIVNNSKKYDYRQNFFDVLRRLGLKSPPSPQGMLSDHAIDALSYAILNNFGKPDTMLVDVETLKAYHRAFDK